MDIKDKIIHELELVIESQAFIIDKLRKDLAEAHAKITELERRLGLDSSNSSKPPSSDGLRKRKVATREPSEKAFGGQMGHAGDTLRQAEEPDEKIIYGYDFSRCESCNASLENVPVTRTIRRDEYEIIIKKKVIAHEVEIKVCPCCNYHNKGKFPEHVKAPAQYGPTARAVSLYLGQQFLSKERVQQTMNDLFDISFTDTTLMKYENDCAKSLKPFMEFVKNATKNAPVKGADETGMRIEKKTKWFHVLCTDDLTYYRASETRGSLLDNVKGIVVHDHWKPYLKLTEAKHAFCNAHHIRELKAAHQLDHELWAKEMMELLIGASKLTNPTSAEILEIEQKYDKIITAGFSYHETLEKPYENSRKKRPGHNLLIRLHKFKTETLRFLHNRDVPFTNNLSERDLRMIKLYQKVSGSFRTFNGANTFATIRSFISTVRKQDGNMLDALQSLIRNGYSSDLLPRPYP